MKHRRNDLLQCWPVHQSPAVPIHHNSVSDNTFQYIITASMIILHHDVVSNFKRNDYEENLQIKTVLVQKYYFYEHKL